MSFRDDHAATRARADALEQELAQARAELAARREPASAPAEARTGGIAWGPIAMFALALASFGAALYAGFVVGGRDAENLGLVLGVVGTLVVAAAVMLLVLRQCLVVVAPNELAILSGRPHRAPDGSVIGFRIVRGARAIRIPLLEQVEFMDLTNTPIELDLADCRVKDGKATIKAIANVKIASEMPYVVNAVERFLGQRRVQIARVAEETLGGALRGVLAAVTLEEARLDPLALAATVSAEAERDLQRLGLVLDTFAVKSVEAA